MVWVIGIFWTTRSAAMPEQNDVAFLDDVLFAFQAHLRLLARRREAPRLQEIIPANYLGANESAFDVGVNCAGCFLRAHAALDGPCAHFGLSRGKKRSEAEQMIGGLNQAIESRRFQSVSRKHLRAFGRLKLGKFGFDASADRDDGGVRTPYKFCAIAPFDCGVEFSDLPVSKIQDIQH